MPLFIAGRPDQSVFVFPKDERGVDIDRNYRRPTSDGGRRGHHRHLSANQEGEGAGWIHSGM